MTDSCSSASLRLLSNTAGVASMLIFILLFSRSTFQSRSRKRSGCLTAACRRSICSIWKRAPLWRPTRSPLTAYIISANAPPPTRRMSLVRILRIASPEAVTAFDLVRRCRRRFFSGQRGCQIEQSVLHPAGCCRQSIRHISLPRSSHNAMQKVWLVREALEPECKLGKTEIY